MTRHRKDGLWMELDAFNREVFVADAHYLIVIDRARGHFEAFRQALSFRDKRMVSRSLERTLYSTKNPLSIVSDRAGLAMTQSLRSNYSAAERVNNPLMSQAYAQCWGFVAHFSEDVRAHSEIPGIAGGAGTRRDYDSVR